MQLNPPKKKIGASPNTKPSNPNVHPPQNNPGRELNNQDKLDPGDVLSTARDDITPEETRYSISFVKVVGQRRLNLDSRFTTSDKGPEECFGNA